MRVGGLRLGGFRGVGKQERVLFHRNFWVPEKTLLVNLDVEITAELSRHEKSDLDALGGLSFPWKDT